MAMVCDQTGRKAAARTTVARSSRRILVVLLYQTKFKISPPFLSLVSAIEHQRPVDPNFLGARVNAEWIPRPKHDIGVLADFDRTDLIVEPQRPGGIDREPLDGLLFGAVDARRASGVHRFGHFLIQTLSAERAVRMNHGARARSIGDGEIGFH